jgi:hypothetical protein
VDAVAAPDVESMYQLDTSGEYVEPTPKDKSAAL